MIRLILVDRGNIGWQKSNKGGERSSVESGKTTGESGNTTGDSEKTKSGDEKQGVIALSAREIHDRVEQIAEGMQLELDEPSPPPQSLYDEPDTAEQDDE